MRYVIINVSSQNVGINVILEHEIPQGTKLYFGASARTKRYIEEQASAILCEAGFEEIVTPSFSFLEHQRDLSSREVLRLSSESNHQIVLRNDTTLDVARIITKRLGRSTEHRKWFYIQPVFSYPSREIHQIGVESLGNRDIKSLLNVSIKILHELKISPILQLANIEIPLLCAREYNLSMELFTKTQIEKILEHDSCIGELLKIKNLEDLERFIANAPSFLHLALQELYELAMGVEYERVIVSPLYYAPMEYYNGVFFRMSEGNRTLLFGGNYEIDGLDSCGFGIYTDELITSLQMEK